MGFLQDGSIQKRDSNSRFLPRADPLGASVRLMMPFETNASDRSLLANTFTEPAGALTYTTPLAGAFGDSGPNFTGTPYLRAVTTANFNVQNVAFTVEAWINIVNSALARNIVAWCENLTGGFAFMYLGVVGGDLLQAAVQNSTGGAGVALNNAVTGIVTPGTWNFVSLSKTGTNAFLHLNGTLIAQTAAWQEYPDALNLNFAVGGYGNGYTDATVGRWLGSKQQVRFTRGFARYGANNYPVLRKRFLSPLVG